MKKVKIKKIFSTILLLFLITLVIGITYAAFTLTEVGSENVITTGSISMSYTESTNVISINNALPTSDTDGKVSSNYFDFNVTSNLTLDDANPKGVASYSIEIEPLSVDTGYTALTDNQIKLYLEDITNNKILVNSKLVSSLLNYNLYTASHKHTKTISSVTTNYRLRAWIDYNVDSSKWNSSSQYEYKFRVNVNGDVDITGATVIPTGTATGQIASQVKTTAISYKYINGANKTIDGITYNNGDNGVFLYDGTDDNGGDYPIYYYRGNVTNNNVLFANMCWKIVRTTSTGGTKLIYNGVPDDSGACNNTGTASQISTSTFNSSSNSPAYVGYMYGTVYTYSSKSPSGTIIYGNDVTYSNGTYTLIGKTMTSTDWDSDRAILANGYHYTCFTSNTTCSSVYYITYFGLINANLAFYFTFTEGDALETAKEKMYTNTTNSTIKTTIDNWYKTNLTSYTSYLEDTIFCNDRSDATGTTYSGPLANKDTNSTDGFSYFKSYENTKNGTPSLECLNQNDRFSLSITNGGTEGFGNNSLTYPVGLLTSDEVELAGGQYTVNYKYYLYNGSEYWTMSPYTFDYSQSSISGVSPSNNLVGYNPLGRGSGMGNYYSIGVRPVISLKLGTTFESGTGLASNPYIVTE